MAKNAVPTTKLGIRRTKRAPWACYQAFSALVFQLRYPHDSLEATFTHPHDNLEYLDCTIILQKDFNLF